MNIRLGAKILLTLGIFFVLGAQIATVSAVPVPVVCPVTSPASYFISGKVFYRPVSGPLSAASGVRVVARNESNKSFSCVTGATGQYVLDVVSGIYSVRAIDTKGTRFLPNLRGLVVDGKVFGIDFIGNN